MMTRRPSDILGAPRLARIDIRWVGLLVAGAVILFLRRPEAFLAAEFTWEEGNAFYAPLFFRRPGELLLEPWGGYLQVVPRLGFELLRAVPVAWAPLSENILAAAGLLGLACYIASERLGALIPARGLRVALGAALILLPAQVSVMGSLVNVQWYGALWLALVCLTTPPASLAAKWSERIVAALVSLSGPFSTLFAPMFWWRLARRRNAEDAWLAAIVTGGGIVQLVHALGSGRADVVDPRPIEMTMATLALHLGVVPLIGERISNALGAIGLPAAVLFAGGLAMIGSLIALAGRSLPSRILPLAYAGGAAAFSGIAVHGGANIWAPGDNERYFLIGAALAVGTVVAGVAQHRRLALPLALLLAAGMSIDFRLDPHPAQGWARTHSCLGSATPCVVPVWPREYDIHWPGLRGPYVMPVHVDP